MRLGFFSHVIENSRNWPYCAATAGLCLRSDVGGGTCVADNVDSSLLVHGFHKRLSDLSGFPPPELVSASGRCDTGRVHQRSPARCSQERRQQRELLTPTEHERQASVWKGELVFCFVCVFVRVGKERVAFPHRRLGLGMASTKILSFLLLIRGEPSLYFGPNHLQRKPQENASLRFLNTVSDQFLLTQTC